MRSETIQKNILTDVKKSYEIPEKTALSLPGTANDNAPAFLSGYGKYDISLT